MGVFTFLMDLQLQGITFAVEGDFLDVSGPDYLLTPETLATIRSKKEELLELLRRPANDPEPMPESVTDPQPVPEPVAVQREHSVILTAHREPLYNREKLVITLLERAPHGTS
jgi:TubC N-terminal docking domain